MGGVETPKPPQNPVGEFVSNEVQTEEVDQPIDKALLKEYTKGYTEVGGKYKTTLNELKADFQKKQGRAPGVHQDRYTMMGADNHEYVYIRDNTNNPKDRLFRSPNAIDAEAKKDEVANVTLDLGSDYVELVLADKKLSKKVGKIVAKMKKELKRENGPTVYTVKLEQLVSSRNLTEDESDAIEDGDALCLYKDVNGKYTTFVGWHKG